MNFPPLNQVPYLSLNKSERDYVFQREIEIPLGYCVMKNKLKTHKRACSNPINNITSII